LTLLHPEYTIELIVCSLKARELDIFLDGNSLGINSTWTLPIQEEKGVLEQIQRACFFINRALKGTINEVPFVKES
jgi:hypothetical protein